MNYINWDVDPEIISVFGITLRYYSLLFIGGLILGYQIVKRIYLKEGIPTHKLDTLTTYIFIGTLLGARLGHCIFYDPAYYFSHPLEMILPFQFTNGSINFTGYQGLASHGGAIGVLIAIIVYSYKFKENLLGILDKVAVAIPVTGACIRIGNLMNSEILGHISNVPWAFKFVKVDTLPRHPAQLYEAIAYLIIFAIVRQVYKNQNKTGLSFGVFLILLFSARIFIELFKVNQVAFEDNLSLNMGQLLSIPFVLAGLVICFRSLRKA